MDQLDLVRAWFQALNRGDLDGVMAAYHDDCVTEQIFAGDEGAGTYEGREANRRMFERLFAEFEGGFDGGARVRIRTIGGIETGWGWVHVEWIERERRRATGEVLQLAGYSHFLIEEGRISRQRSVASRTDEDAIAADVSPVAALSSRSYPSRPIVGVGAVILVDGRVVLIKRRFEPLAGQWSLPGGTLEVGETLEAGVAREMAEETGLTVEVGPVVEVFDRILLDEDRRVRYHFVLIDYLCRPVGGRLAHGSDVADVALADPNDLASYRLTPKAASIIRKAVELAASL
jgi:ADP-ribose pyrophosphatase YjhB (NUDIX family)/ketosteroid isomerase-like protein